MLTDKRTHQPIPDASKEQPQFTKPKIIVKVIRENHEAEMIIQNTTSHTSEPTMEDFKEALAESGVTTGIKEKLLKELLTSLSYNYSYVVAMGKKPTVGKDGELRYHIRTEQKLRPVIREDGTADYKELGYTNNVEKGQVLVDIIPPCQGEDGVDVLGNVLPGIFGKEARSPQGPGTEFSEDGSQLIAAVSGNAVVKNGVITIQEVLKIKGNVNNSTGDISFMGDIEITGDILSGFTVSSGANITVKGTVEGAQLEAKGDIVVSEGINGMNRGKLIAGGNIKCRYMQSCDIKAGGSIYADTIMYCTVECDGDVEFIGKRGMLAGGQFTVAGNLIAKTIGTQSHTVTRINMIGGGMVRKREQEELQRQIKDIDEGITKMVQMLNRFDSMQRQNSLDEEHLNTIMRIKQNYMTLSTQRKDVMERLEQAKKAQLEASDNSYVECKGKMYSGVRLSFGPLVYNVQQDFVNSRFGIADEEILISTL